MRPTKSDHIQHRYPGHPVVATQEERLEANSPLCGPDVLLSPALAAQLLQLKPATLADMRCKGSGPKFCKAGRLVRYRLADLREWLESRTFTNTTQAKEGVSQKTAESIHA